MACKSVKLMSGTEKIVNKQKLISNNKREQAAGAVQRATLGEQ